MKRLPWGHKSRHCIYCNRVGPRVIVAGGYAHRRCIGPAARQSKRKHYRGVDDGKPRENTVYGNIGQPKRGKGRGK